MPEGHSIYRLARVFEESFTSARCQLSSPQGRFASGAALLDGEYLTGVDTKGKHLFLGFSPVPDAEPDRWIHVHLGFYGSWRFAGNVSEASIGAPRNVETGGQSGESGGEFDPPDPVGQVRLRILTRDAVADLTGPNRCEVITPAEKAAVEERLGPDPLHPRPSELREEFVSKVRASTRPIGELVMDQAISAGVGNIYRAEALFRTGISPFRAGRRVSEQRLRLLWDDFVKLLQRGVREGTIRTVRREHELADEADPEAARFYVYHRGGRPCLQCGAPVREKDLRGRQVYWCANCQR